MATDPAVGRYAAKLPARQKAICRALEALVDGALPKASARVWHAMPVWFLGENPVVGYKAGTTHVTLLFWNGQAFGEPALAPVGKFSAAQVKYAAATELDPAALRRWLRKAGKQVWDAKRALAEARARKAP